MEKNVVITFNHKELTEILGVKLLMDFGDYKVNGIFISEEKIDETVDYYENLLVEHVKTTQTELFDMEPIGSYARLFPLGLSAAFKSNQELSGSVSIVYPKTEM